MEPSSFRDGNLCGTWRLDWMRSGGQQQSFRPREILLRLGADGTYEIQCDNEDNPAFRGTFTVHGERLLRCPSRDVILDDGRVDLARGVLTLGGLVFHQVSVG